LFFNIWNHIPSSPPPFDWISFVVSISKIYLFYFQNSEKKRISVIYHHNPHLSHFKFQNIFTPRSVLYVWTMDHSDTVFFSPPRKTLYIYIYIYIYIGKRRAYYMNNSAKLHGPTCRQKIIAETSSSFSNI